MENLPLGPHLPSPIDRRFGWTKEFYSFSLDENQMPKIERVTLNIFQRIGRAMFGGYKNTHHHQFTRVYEHISALASYETMLEKTREIIPQNKERVKEELKKLQMIKETYFQHASAKADRTDLLLSFQSSAMIATDGRKISEEITRFSDFSFVKIAKGPEERFNTAHAAWRKQSTDKPGEPLVKVGVISSGVEHNRSSEGAAFQIMHYAMAIGETSKYDIDYEESHESVQSKMLLLAEECRELKLTPEANWEPDKSPATSFLFYKIIYDGKGHKRLVGCACGGGLIMAYRKGGEGVESRMKLIQEPRYRFNSFAQKFEPERFITDMKDFRGEVATFDILLEENEIIIPASTGFIKVFAEDGVDLVTSANRMATSMKEKLEGPLGNLAQAFPTLMESKKVSNREDCVIQFIV